MRLNSFSFLLLFMFALEIAAEKTGVIDGNRLIERLEALEIEQRESKLRIETLERTAKDQAQIIESQSRDIEAFRFIIHEHKARIQRAYRQSKLNRLDIHDMRQILMSSGPNASKTSETDKQRTSLEQDNETGQEFIDIGDERTDTKHPVNARVTRQNSSIGRFASKRQERAGVSFSVYIDHDVDLGAHQTLKFNQIITNEGNGYSKHSGVFTCPESGMYLFSFFVGQRDETAPRGILAELMVNSKNVLDTQVDSHTPGQDITGGNVAVVRLNQGDVVWVDSLGNNGHVEGSTGFKLTSFSGVFLYP